MLDSFLPALINPVRLAEKHTSLKGILLLAKMPRLEEVLANTTGEALVAMDFGRDENHNVFIHLKVNTDVVLTCQRCMESLSYPILVDVLLSPLKEDAKTPPTYAYEPLIMDSELIAVQDMVEDEILLNLPLIAKHAQNVCPVVLSPFHENNTESPFFKVLSKLKK